MSTLWNVLTRRKVLDDTGNDTPLARVLNTFDLTALGVGSTLGVGVYVLAGQVAKNTAGPAVIISFLIAAIASVFAGLCYAEFGARTPKAGSAYIYSYVCVGEFIAFVIGWNLILEYIIGSASVAKGLSSYVDNLCNGSLSNTFKELAPIDLPYLSPYFDVFAFCIPIFLSIALAFGMKESSLLNNIFTTCNIGVVLFVIVAGAMNAHLSNWSINPDDVKNVTNGTVLGHGGFFPFGIQGVIKGAATCFYGFVGFDCIATTGEEVKNPKRAIPIAIICSLLVIFLAYFGTSTVLTLMVPYYEQDSTAPIPFAFQQVHWYTAAYVVSIGAMFGLYASLFGAMFPLPRILYAMASDGLIFKCLGRVDQRFQTPVIGTLLAGIFTGTMAAVFALDSLVNMMSIGTLLAYTIVAACVLLLRYSVDEKGYEPIPGSSDPPEDRYVGSIEPINASEETALTGITEENSCALKQIFNFGKIRFPNKISQTIVSIDICFFCILSFLFGLCALYLSHDIANGEVIPLSVVAVILILMAFTMLSISSQPVSRTTLSFQVPWVPLIPALSIFCNIYLMVMLDIATWVRFAVWMIIGIPTFYLTRWCISDINETIRNDSPIQAYQNDGFYGDNLVLSNGNGPNQDNFIRDEKIIPPLKIVENSDENVVQTPSPSRIIESLDLVIDSYADTAPAYVMSASETRPAFVLSDNPSNSDFRDTPNRALRTLLLENLKDDIKFENEVEISNENGLPVDHDDVKSVLTNDEDDLNNKTVIPNGKEKDIHSKLDEARFSSSSSEVSYISASSNIDVGQNESLVKSDSQLSPIPPPPPPPPPLPFNDRSFEKIDLYSTNDKTLKNEKLKPPKRETPMFVNKNSLNSVKLRHVHRPSIERSRSSNDIANTDDLDLKQSNEEITSPLVHLKHVKRPSLERKSENIRTKELNDSQANKTGRYLKSKSVNDLEKKNNTSKDDNSSNTLKRMGISKDAINSVKLKPVVRPSLPLDREPKADLPDSVKFGTPEFQEFKDVLNRKLQKPVKILREPSFVDSKTIVKKPDVLFSKEDVIEDHLDLAKARATMENEVGNKLNYLKQMTETDNPSKKNDEEN